MEDLQQDYHPLVWHEDGHYNPWTADLSPGSSTAADDSFRTVDRHQPDWMWELSTTSSPSSNNSQSFWSADPRLRLNTEVGIDQNQHCTTFSHRPSFGFPSPTSYTQWPNQGDTAQYVDFHNHQTSEPRFHLVHAHALPAAHPVGEQSSARSPSTIFDNNADSLPIWSRPVVPRSSGTSQPANQPSMPWPDVFASTKGQYRDPPKSEIESEQPQRKAKRSADDLYTPHWVRNHGSQREGWCGWCSTWYTLRDSTYWYHMHYSHGISQANGKRLPHPAGFRVDCDATEWQIKCGKCSKWMPLATKERWPTAYFRHTYKCYFKSNSESKAQDAAVSSSPVRAVASPTRAGARSSRMSS